MKFFMFLLAFVFLISSVSAVCTSNSYSYKSSEASVTSCYEFSPGYNAPGGHVTLSCEGQAQYLDATSCNKRGCDGLLIPNDFVFNFQYPISNLKSVRCWDYDIQSSSSNDCTYSAFCIANDKCAPSDWGPKNSAGFRNSKSTGKSCCSQQTQIKSCTPGGSSSSWAYASTGWDFSSFAVYKCNWEDSLCNGFEYSVCNQDRMDYTSQGIVQGKCGVACTNLGEETCVGLSNSVCELYAWKDKGKVYNKCGYNWKLKFKDDLKRIWDSFWSKLGVGSFTGERIALASNGSEGYE